DSGPVRVGGPGGLPDESAGSPPRWPSILGLVAVLTLVATLARFAIDLLGLVFLIVVVGVSLRALSDWLTEGDSVSAWSLGAVGTGLGGTLLVGAWLFGSVTFNPDTALSGRVPRPVVSAVTWLEARGWGQRVLLQPGVVQAQRAATGSGSPLPGGSTLASPAPTEQPGYTVRAPQPLSPGRQRRSDSTGEAEAAVPPVAAGRTAGAAGRRAEAARQVATVTTVSTAFGAVRVGTSVRLTAIVQPTSGIVLPTGKVAFYSGATVLGTSRLHPSRGGARAALSVLDLPIGVHELWAEYTGSSGFAPSRAKPVRQVVTRE
ncbi:MAG TPA: Ig-like domain-containing protein, partial [Methylomirabilota bacterium]